jgi:hypothetical protein
LKRSCVESSVKNYKRRINVSGEPIAGRGDGEDHAARQLSVARNILAIIIFMMHIDMHV